MRFRVWGLGLEFGAKNSGFRISGFELRGTGSGFRRNVKRFRRGLVFKAQRFSYHSAAGLRVIEKKRRFRVRETCARISQGSSGFKVQGSGFGFKGFGFGFGGWG